MQVFKACMFFLFIEFTILNKEMQENTQIKRVGDLLKNIETREI